LQLSEREREAKTKKEKKKNRKRNVEKKEYASLFQTQSAKINC
jgi:hypothetical protein